MTKFRLLIDGKMVDGAARSPVLNPATEEAIADCPRASATQLDDAVAAAKRAFPAWSRLPMAERQQRLNMIAGIIEANIEELGRLLTLEQGKPLDYAQGEVGMMAGFFRYYATLDLATKVLEDSETKKVEVRRRPLGVIAAIIPWNFPLSLAATKIAPAMLAGNTVVLKPAPTTPLATLRFAELVADALPAGVLNVIADENDLGDRLSRHPDVRKVSFTGSTATGRKVMSAASEMLKRVTLELGGNDAGIVLEDVDVKTAASGIFAAAFFNTGQTCAALKRLYVHESIYDEMCEELCTLAESAIIGDGLQQGTQYGPIQNRMQYERVLGLLESARQDGKIVAGGTVPEGPGYFMRPTIVRDVKDGHRIVDEEQFGPILPVLSFSDPEDAIDRANASPYGLNGSIWSGDYDRALELADRMECGTVGINHHLDFTGFNPAVPFGGAKQSGMGTEWGEEGLLEYTQVQVRNALRPQS